MESRLDSTDSNTSPARVPEGGKLSRIAAHTQNLVEDLREWIDLRLDLTVLEMEEQVDRLQNQIALTVTLAILGFFAGLFTLTTVALGLGWALGHPFFGFLIVAGALILLLAVLRAAKPELVPSSDLFQKIRRGDAEEESQTPTRDADASVADASKRGTSRSRTSGSSP